MGQTNLRASLRKRHSQLKGQRDDLALRIEAVKRDMAKLDELEAELPKLDELIRASELLLKDNDPDFDPDENPPLKPWTHHIPVPFGQCGRRGLKVLKEANAAMSVRQVAQQVLREVGVDEPELETLRRVQNAIESSFRKFDGRTVESSGAYPKQWRSIVKRELKFDP
ncbi:hypothetical protein [Aurantiacibacter gangjinensis]|uniref:Uncharacterized protein n=1 Tax=Aurantiacibacter gangjinensis TaxID=502682 RepID=A0A0G9MK68_9SPHN|nr:hypothetical protein [Aurantiacibacter gangjinensis]KLE31090.1 hypothetical protein AAW01_12680 [Aurantiacibacter gangjinensis]